MRYLNPKADLTFKKVFGEHPNLVKSLLNALLPFDCPEEEIEDLDYLTPELVPDTPFKKNSIVDVRCRDKRGRQFIVEMQMLWSPAFMQRVLFNASKAYVRQLDGTAQDEGYTVHCSYASKAYVRQLGGTEKYELLQPVYSLNLVNDIFLPDLAEYYHDYRIVRMAHTDKVIEGLRFIFVELPKFTPHSYNEKKMQVLWLRYLTEIDEQTNQVPKDLLDNPEIHQAVMQIEESAFSDAQLLGYDEFWDAVRVESALVSDALKEGLAEGRAKGLAEGRAEGLAEGRAEGRAEGLAEGRAEGRAEVRLSTARNLKKMGVAPDTIARATGLSFEEIEKL